MQEEFSSCYVHAEEEEKEAEEEAEEEAVNITSCNACLSPAVLAYRHVNSLPLCRLARKPVVVKQAWMRICGYTTSTIPL